MKIRKEISTVKPLELANGWELFVQKPLDYSENSNNEMRKIMELLQWTYLNLVHGHIKFQHKDIPNTACGHI